MNHIRLAGHLETSVQNDAKMTLNTTKSLRYPILNYSASTSLSPKFQSFLLCEQLFSSYWKFWHKCTKNDPKMTLNNTRSKVPFTYSTSNHESQIYLFALLPRVFKLETTLWQEQSEWPPNDLEHYKVNGTQYNVILVSQSPKF